MYTSATKWPTKIGPETSGKRTANAYYLKCMVLTSVSSPECHVQLSNLRRHMSYTQKRTNSVTTPGPTTHLFAR